MFAYINSFIYISHLHTVLVCLSCCNRIPLTGGGFHNKHLFLPESSGGWNPRWKLWPIWCLARVRFLLCRRPSSPGSPRGGKGKGALWGLFSEGATLMTHPLRTPPWAKCSAPAFGGGTNIRSVHNTCNAFTYSKSFQSPGLLLRKWSHRGSRA